MTIESANSGWESNDDSHVEPILILSNTATKVATPIDSMPETEQRKDNELSDENIAKNQLTGHSLPNLVLKDV